MLTCIKQTLIHVNGVRFTNPWNLCSHAVESVRLYNVSVFHMYPMALLTYNHIVHTVFHTTFKYELWIAELKLLISSVLCIYLVVVLVMRTCVYIHVELLTLCTIQTLCIQLQ